MIGPTGPDSFTVKTKSGLIKSYGSRGGGRVEAEGSSTVRYWALDRVEDAAGNFEQITVRKLHVTGAAQPHKWYISPSETSEGEVLTGVAAGRAQERTLSGPWSSQWSPWGWCRCPSTR